MLNTEAMSGVVRVDKIFKTFPGNTDPVLRGVSVDFPAKQLTYVLGPSGTGKSVLLKHVLGLLRPDSGEIWVGGKNINLLRGKELAEHRMCFGMLFQNAALFDDMTVYENVAFPLHEHTRLAEGEIRDRVQKNLEILGMSAKHQAKYPSELSGGMKKRVALARAIIREPSILLYDEPTTGLDPVTRVTVDELIATLKQRLGLTSLVISHDIPSALLLADWIAFLYRGEIVFFGRPHEFLKADHPEIKSFLESERRSLKALSV
ncbi:MAG: ATP-binding cassette domain-containing protein [Bdellovibrionota bacterium]